MESSHSSLPYRVGLLLFVIVMAMGWGIPGHTQDLESEKVETLDAIQVPGTAVIREKRDLTFPEPNVAHFSSMSGDISGLRIPDESSIAREFGPLPVSIDETGKTHGIRSSVKPMKAERPSYPRFAREQGWEGTVILRLMIDRDGHVSSAKLRESSGYPLLDESAVQAVRDWIFTPAKNGEFSVPATVDLPVRFDLDK